MTIHDPARRNANIFANAYSRPGQMTPQLEARLGLDMIARARAEGHFARMPPSPKDENAARRGGKASVKSRGLVAQERERVEEVIIALLAGSRTYDDLTRITGLSREVIKKALGRLLQAGLVVRGHRGQRATWRRA